MVRSPKEHPRKGLVSQDNYNEVSHHMLPAGASTAACIIR
jgi:hypothetical protein